MRKLIFPMVLTAVFLTGCEEDARSVDYYLNHPAERQSKSESCYDRNDTKSDGCINAHKADIKHVLGLENIEKRQQEAKEAFDLLNKSLSK